MPADNPVRGAAETERPGVTRAWAVLVDGLAALGTVMIVGLMLVVVADVLTRNILGGSLPLVSELGALMVVMIVFLQLATTVRLNRLARTDVLLAVIGQSAPRVGNVLEALFCLAGAAVSALIAWQTFNILSRDLSIGEYIGVTGVMTVPTWPFRVLILVGISVAALQFLFSAVGQLRRAFVPGGAA
ncbi:TRAP transporter small permease [Acuticoccus sp. MNP-M23]|uniref:TRAP transporter small permease subunit n=1 Tax=Acuticoccus sp. MNP-M23 TaxID=3072793 RepID=UPI002816970F|nr:TRAP transporter small permease [Acuticoccus sp. MNP-M23]WMS44578.1 TRAP transporter small permease [Acuticoccus sp. MNP-M23]